MSCEHDWTIRINDVTHDREHIEFRPVSMTLNMPRSGMDFLRAKLPSEVGDMLQPNTVEGGRLSYRKIAEVRLDGQTVQKMLFVPDGVSYGRNFAHIKLYDTIKAMDDGVVDKQWSNVTLLDAYQHVFDQVTNDLVDGPVFSLPQNVPQRLTGTGGIFEQYESTVEGQEKGGIARAAGGMYNQVVGFNLVDRINQSQTQKLIDSYFAVDFNKISPLKAITKLNKKFSVNTWTSRSGAVYVGYPEANATGHIAAPDDQRVWRYKDPQLSHAREPVKSVIVEGAWVDEPGIGGLDDVVSWFDPGSERGVGDAIALGYAERTDVEQGISYSVKNTRAKKNSLQDVAEAALREKMKEQSSGTIEIDPSISGEEATPVRSVRPGDMIRLVPPDHLFKNPVADSGAPWDPPENDDYCGSYVRNDIYVVSEVEHRLSESGNWMVSLDVGKYPDTDVGTILKYWLPERDKTIKPSKFEEESLFEDINTEESEAGGENYPDEPMY